MSLLRLLSTTIIDSFIKIHTGTLFIKIKSSFILALSVSPLAYIIEKLSKWTINNQDYIMVVLGAIIIDHIVGTILHAFYRKDFTWKKNFTGIAVKVSLVIMIGFIFEGLNVIAKHDSVLKDYLIIVTRLSVFLYPAGSALMNTSEITGGVFPPIGWVRKIKSFNQNLTIPTNLEEITNDTNSQQKTA